ncbi:MAG: DUF4384 domain-containing protein [Acidobacteriota bacterium]
MKRRFIIILLLALAFGLSGYSPAQAMAQSEDQTRDLFASYAATGAATGRPGAKIRIELLREGRRQFVPLNTTFRAGDRVKLHFEVNFAAYVTIYNLGTSGRVNKLYPAQSKFARAAASTNYVVPASATEWFEFDETPGIEKLNFTFSSVVPQRRQAKTANKQTGKPAAPSETGQKATDVVIVEPGGRALGDEADSEASDEALDNGRDLKPVQLKDAYYVMGNVQQLRQRVGIVIALQHR